LRSSGVAGVQESQELMKERKDVAAFMTYANNAVTKNFSASARLLVKIRYSSVTPLLL